MSSVDAIFQVYYNGRFKSEGNNITYVGGEVHTLESKSETMLVNMMDALKLSLCRHRIWYKLPFEDLSQLKIMCTGDRDQNFRKMCEAVFWTKAADIFLEEDEDADEIENRPETEEYGGHEAVVDGQGDISDETEILDEDARVEENVAGFEDEEDCANDEDTPHNSDDEKGGGRKPYVRGKKGSGDLTLGQVFDTIAEFKDAVVDYSLKEKSNLMYTKWGDEKSEVRCSIGGDCEFRIYCSFCRDEGKYVIKSFNDEHSCTCATDGFSKVVKDRIIAKLILNDIRKDPTYKPKKIQDDIEEKYDLVVTYDQCRKAKKKALMMVQDEYDAQFTRIKDYRLELIRSNPGSTVEVGTLRSNEGPKFSFALLMGLTSGEHLVNQQLNHQPEKSLKVPPRSKNESRA